MILHVLVTDARAGERAARAGATVVQLRMKDVTTRARVAEGRALQALLRREHLSPLLVINDDVDAALELGAYAVHLGQGDIGVARACRHGLRFGRSVAGVDMARIAAADGADYLGVGPIWPTPSKPDAGRAIGLPGLEVIASAVGIPVIAIGGIDASNAGACLRAGASGVAVLRAIAELVRIRAILDGVTTLR